MLPANRDKEKSIYVTIYKDELEVNPAETSPMHKIFENERGDFQNHISINCLV